MTPERKVGLLNLLMTLDVIVGFGGFVVLVVGLYLRFNMFESSIIFKNLVLLYIPCWGLLFILIMIAQTFISDSINSETRIKYGVGKDL